MVESRSVLEKGRIRATIEKLPDRAPGKDSISVCTEKRYNSCEYRKTIGVSTETGFNQCEDRKMVESGRVMGKARIRASIEKLFGRVQENGSYCVCTEKW